jgi:hypothetical protein
MRAVVPREMSTDKGECREETSVSVAVETRPRNADSKLTDGEKSTHMNSDTSLCTLDHQTYAYASYLEADAVNRYAGTEALESVVTTTCNLTPKQQESRRSGASGVSQLSDRVRARRTELETRRSALAPLEETRQ